MQISVRIFWVLIKRNTEPLLDKLGRNGDGVMRMKTSSISETVQDGTKVQTTSSYVGALV